MQRRKKNTGARKMKNATTRRDETLREFEKQDLLAKYVNAKL